MIKIDDYWHNHKPTKKPFTPSKSKIYKMIEQPYDEGRTIQFKVVRTNGDILYPIWDTFGLFLDEAGLTETEKKMIVRRI